MEKKICRQQRWKEKMRSAGMCPGCGKLNLTKFALCAKCLIADRERARERRGYKRRNINSKSYALSVDKPSSKD